MCGGVFFQQPQGSNVFVTSMESRRNLANLVFSCVMRDVVSRVPPLISHRASFDLCGFSKADKNTTVLKSFPPILQSFASCLYFCATAGYKISYRVDSRDPQRWTTVEVGSNGRQFTVTGLSAEQTYVFRLIARTAVGWGEQLEALVVTTERRGQSNVIVVLVSQL